MQVPEIPLRALIFDSYYDDYRGVILYVRIVDGELKKNDQIYMMATRAHGLALEIGKLAPGMDADIALLGPGLQVIGSLIGGKSIA